MMNGKMYLGDGVYALFDGLSIVLTTENGVGVTNTIVIDPEVLLNFELWLKHLREMQGHEITYDSLAAHEDS